MQRDKQIVVRFLSEYNKSVDSTYQIKEWPDEVEHSKKAVEAIALDESGTRLAIEHTLIQPFVGEREDAQPFLNAIAPLEHDPSLTFRDYYLYLSIPVGAIPKGVDWQEAGRKVAEWLRQNSASLPPGYTEHIVPNLPFVLRISINKVHHPGMHGKVYVARNIPPDSLQEVVRNALSDKLPKLAATPANRRFLILEKADIVHFYNRIGEAVRILEPHFADLERIDEIWVADTVAWEREGWIWFHLVWCNPDKRSARTTLLESQGMIFKERPK